MAATVSVRIEKSGLKEIEGISKTENKSRSEVLREVFNRGLQDKKLELAIEKFRNKEATAWKAARMAGMPLSRFMDILVQRGIDFHYGLKELEEDFEGLV